MKKTFFCTAFFICVSAACLSIYINQITPRDADLISKNIEVLSQVKSVTVPCKEMKKSSCTFDIYDYNGHFVKTATWSNYKND